MSFAKALQFKGNECLVKASECRKFRQQLRTQFPLLSSEQLERIWPNKSQLRQQQLQGRTTIYICNEQPIFYVHERALYPSLYFLHVAPQIMTAVALAKGVAPALLRGADVFMPGRSISCNAVHLLIVEYATVVLCSMLMLMRV
eukprot:m.35759 g.35759  ORF g.35759 m.35759 type:complete len:144 (+) comp9920_c0_seq1:196-627(+)